MSRYPIIGVDEHPVTDSVLIDGPPGTGKTTQISERIEGFLKETGCSIHNVQLVTYRNALAEDIVDRLKDDGLVSESFNAKKSKIGTLHAICNRLIRDETSFDVSNKVSWFHKKVFCDYVGLQYGSSKDEKTAGKELFQIFGWMLSTQSTPQQVPPEKYDSLVSAAGRHVDLREMWSSWNDFKQNPPVGKFDDLDEGDELYDFDELLRLVSEQKITPSNIDLLVVDEMHDVYPAMYDVIQMWMDEMDDTTFIIAGDKHQVITEYQGASPEFYESIDLPEVSLPTTYRCPQSHVDYAHNVLSHQLSPPDVEADSDDGLVTDVTAPTMFYQDFHGEWTVSTAQNNPADLYDDYVGDDETTIFAVRANFQAEPIAKSLRSEGIPFSCSSNDVDDFKDSNLIDLYNGLCKCRTIPEDPEYTYDGGFEFDSETDSTITSDELIAVIDAVPATYISGTKYDAQNVFSDLDGYQISKLHNVFTDEFFTELHQNPVEILLSSVDKSNLARLVEKHDFELLDEDGIRTQILTIHASKGLEADNVFLYDGIPEQIHESLTKSNATDENECRVWYVGATRASDTLVIVRNAFDGLYNSPFLPLVNSAPEGAEVVQ